MQRKSTKVIGAITTYLGDEIPGLKGHKVRILYVLRGALRPDCDPEADDYLVNDEEVLERLGGVTADDRVDAQMIHPDGRQSFVHIDPRAVDLECFAHLRRNTKRKTPRRAAKSKGEKR